MCVCVFTAPRFPPTQIFFFFFYFAHFQGIRLPPSQPFFCSQAVAAKSKRETTAVQTPAEKKRRIKRAFRRNPRGSKASVRCKLYLLIIKLEPKIKGPILRKDPLYRCFVTMCVSQASSVNSFAPSLLFACSTFHKVCAALWVRAPL